MMAKKFILTLLPLLNTSNYHYNGCAKKQKKQKNNTFFLVKITLQWNLQFFFVPLKSPNYGCQILSLISQFVRFLSNTHYNGY